MRSFESWYRALVKLAKKEGLLWLISEVHPVWRVVG